MADDIEEWLNELSLGRYAQAFADNEIDLDALPHITDEDLTNIGVALGARRKLLSAAADFCRPEQALVEENRPAPRSPDATVERRQLTVMFIDLVGSTELSTRLDPEDLREVMHAYQNLVAGEVARYEGHVAKFMGDGVLVYFGYPKAHEDDAERAVRAGLSVAKSASNLKEQSDISLSVRVGIATGLIVIGDFVGEGAAQEEAITGETPNLAARLQELAEPGEVMISDATRRLIGETFKLKNSGVHTLKGFSERVLVWGVAGERETATRFEATHGASLAPFAGRGHELGLLLDRWTQAKQREGQVVMLSGEAGIGKSRITQCLRESIAGELFIRLRYQCVSYYASTALHPFIRQLERAAGFKNNDGADSKLKKIEALLAGSVDDVAGALPIFANFLSIPLGESQASLTSTPQQLKERTLEALCDQVIALSRRQPVLIVFEDVHWADPTTLEALALAIDRIQRASVLAVITYRPEFSPPFHDYNHVTALKLNRLGGEVCASIVANLTDGKALPEEVLDQIVAKTDGVPLFVEELTKTVLQSGILEDRGNRYALNGPLPPLAIPSTLKDSLMARLDRLSSAKEVAQVGAAIGRDFSFSLLAAVNPLSEAELAQALAELVDAELIFQRGTPPDSHYTFKHALLQDAAYTSLLKARRQVLHQNIAEALMQPAAVPSDVQPELIAHHLTNAGLYAEAVAYWKQAGERALARFANKEAIVHVTKALDHLIYLPEGRDRDTLELELRLSIGPAHFSTGGFASAESRETYTRAHTLCKHVGKTTQKFAATWGLWLNHQQGADFETAERLAQELVAITQQQSDSEFRLQAHHSAWTSSLPRGDFAQCYEHSEQGIALYDAKAHRGHAHIYGGHDPGICCRAHAAMSAWLLGYPDRGLPYLRDGVKLAQDLQQPLSQMIILTFGGIFHQFRGEAAEAKELAEKAISVGNKHNILQHLAVALIIHGWALVGTNATEAGLQELDRGLSQYRATGAKLRRSYYLCLMAEVCMVAGDLNRGLAALAEAETVSRQIDESWWLAESYRLRGEILAASGETPETIEECFQTARRLAAEQKARSLELRATMSLARMWTQQGRHIEAKELLAPIYSEFSEGFGTADLKTAKALLRELN